MLSLLVPQAVAKEIEKRLSKLAKKADVSVTSVAGLTYLGPHRRSGQTGLMPCQRYTVGEFPRVAGWALVGRLEHTEAGVLTACAPNETLPEAYRTAKPICEHCGTSRYRRDTFVVRNPQGELRQIGRNCLADFLMADPSALIAAAELAQFLNESEASDDGDDDNIFGGGGSWYQPKTALFVACAVACIDRSGFKKSGQDDSTVKEAGWYYSPLFTDRIFLKEKWRAGQPTTEQKEARGIDDRVGSAAQRFTVGLRAQPEDRDRAPGGGSPRRTPRRVADCIRSRDGKSESGGFSSASRKRWLLGHSRHARDDRGHARKEDRARVGC